jgi:hypothetical protein
MKQKQLELREGATTHAKNSRAGVGGISLARDAASDARQELRPLLCFARSASFSSLPPRTSKNNC